MSGIRKEMEKIARLVEDILKDDDGREFVVFTEYPINPIEGMRYYLVYPGNGAVYGCWPTQWQAIEGLEDIYYSELFKQREA